MAARVTLAISKFRFVNWKSTKSVPNLAFGIIVIEPSGTSLSHCSPREKNEQLVGSSPAKLTYSCPAESASPLGIAS